MFDDLINRIDKTTENLNKNIMKQPYIIFNKVKMYFKNPSSELEIEQKNDMEFSLKYYYHNIKSNVEDINNYDGDIHEKLEHLLSDMDNYINEVENTQIIKNMNFSFNIETSSNFNDEYLVNSMINSYITNNLNDKYKNYKVISNTNEYNNNSRLYTIELEYNNETIIEYYLLFNVFCIKLTQREYKNIVMKNMISKMLLSISLSQDQQNPFLNFTKENLKQGFEIESKNDSINKKSISTRNDSSFNEEIEKKLTKFINILKNYKKIENNNDFNINQVFNFLLLGNNSNEKEELIDYIKNLLKEYKIFGENINIFELDLKREYQFSKNVVSIIHKNTKSNDVIYIDNFDFVIHTTKELENNIIETLKNLIYNNKVKCIIVSGKKEETLSIINKSNDLSNNFSYKIELEDYSINRIYNMLIQKIKNLDYKISFEENNAKEIIKKIYKQSDTKNDTFVNRLYTKMVQHVLENNLNEFNEDCFPIVSDENNINDSIKELDDLIGLENIKKEIKRLISFWKYKIKIEKETSIKDTSLSLNMFLTGNPGTGKTTVARILANILYNLEYIKENKIIEVTPNDLVADYEGQTKTKTKEILNQAQDGVLFIDEAYLFLNNQSSYFREALVELLKYIENSNNIVFFAGYSNLMKKFLDVNPGLKSRIGYFLDFEDYNIEELLKILQFKLKKKGLTIENDAIEKVKPIIEKNIKIKNFGNARYIDKLITNIVIKHSENLENSHNDEKLLIITKEDIDTEELLKNELKINNSFGFIKENGDVK